MNQFEDRITEPFNPAEERVSEQFWNQLQLLPLVSGLVLAGLFVLQLVASVAYLSSNRLKVVMEPWVVSSNTRGEGRVKRAATRKINKLISNAYALHALADGARDGSSEIDNVETTTRSAAPDKTMLNFVLYGEKRVPTGGLVWTLRRLWNNDLFEVDGIWLPTRLIVFQCAQLVLAIALSWGFFFFSARVADAAEEADSNLDPSLPQWVKNIVPNRRQVESALYPASTVAVVVMALLVAVYIPSAASTVLQYRCGLFPSLGSPYFNKYRVAADTAHMNTGNAIYGLIGSASLFYAVIGLVIFLFIWDFSQPLMIRILAWG